LIFFESDVVADLERRQPRCVVARPGLLHTWLASHYPLNQVAAGNYAEVWRRQ
jgi:hypothetical protein